MLNMGMASMTTWLRRWGTATAATVHLSAPATLSNGNDDKPDEFAADPAGYYYRSTLASRV